MLPHGVIYDKNELRNRTEITNLDALGHVTIRVREFIFLHKVTALDHS